jgi:hypothetical protein
MLPKVPDGFTVSVYAELEAPRMMVYAPNGDLFVSSPTANSVTVLRARTTTGGSRRARKACTRRASRRQDVLVVAGGVVAARRRRWPRRPLQ